MTPSLAPVNPATGEVFAKVSGSSREEVRAKIKFAREVQLDWRSWAIKHRVACLKRLSEILAREQDAFSKLIVEETGKTAVDALVGEILPSLLLIDYVCRNAPRLLRPRKISTGWIFGHESTVLFDPLGVIGIITPWNFPVYITLSSAAPALAAGNAVITKPSHFTPMSILKLEEMFAEAGFPPGIFTVVPGDSETGTALIEAGVDKIVFTGSVDVGRKISVACAEKFIPCTLELGGKDPMIVLEDAPMPRTVHGALYGGLCHAGQLCMSIERIYVVEKIAREFIDSLIHEAKQVTLGRDVGPLQNAEQLHRVENQLEEALKEGAAILVGGGRGAFPGFYYIPTILLNVPEHSKMYSDESFGPLFYVKVVGDEEEAIRLANESAYGLTASVWSTDILRAEKIAKRLQTGSVFINDHITPAGNPHAPWSGTKQSGMGTQRGEWGIYSMVQIRHFGRSRLLFSKDLFWFPRTAKQEKLARGLIQGLFSKNLPERLKGFWKALGAFFST